MSCTAIITEDGIDQIIENEDGEPDYVRSIIQREVRDLRKLGCTVKTKQFENETLAYEWAEKRFF